MRSKISLVAMAVLALVSVGSAQGGGRQGGFGRGGAQRLIQLIRNTQVQDELKLTDDQKAKVEALPRPQRGGPGGGGGAGGGGGQRPAPPTPEEQAKQLTDDKVVTAAILTADQEKRLEELRIQWAGPAAVSLPDVQTALGLTDDQKAKLSDLATKMREANAALRQKVQNGEMDQADMFPTIQKNNEIYKTEIEKVLTADQTAKLKAMGGAELKQEFRRPGGR